MTKSVALFVSGPNLWATDGTAAGTSELSVSGPSSAGLLADEPSYLTALGHLGLFEGEDSNNHFNLWVTDGTSSGTSELMIAGPSLNGLPSPPDFTVFGDRALFAGDDKNGHVNLWVTDGTLAGTSEIIPASGTGPGGLQPRDIGVFGNKALFVGFGPSTGEQSDLWLTDGTGAGTSELSVTGAILWGCSPAGRTPISLCSVARCCSRVSGSMAKPQTSVFG